MDICRDLADGHLDGTYSQADLQAYQYALAHDPTIQGYCSPLVVITTPPVTTTTTTPGTTSTVATTTTTTTTTPGTTSTVAATTTTTPPTTTSGVAGTTATKVAPAPKPQKTGVAGAQKTKSPPHQQAVAPLTATKSSGTLPFTGTQLTIFAIVGAALLAAGFLLRLSARNKKSRP